MWQVRLGLLVLLTSLFCEVWCIDPDVHKDMVEIVEEKGYPIEEYYIETDDGYLLGTFRIPYGRDETAESVKDISKPAVLLQHGLLDSSYAWVCNSFNESLGFLLADAGYDVWFGNNRGNDFSKQHVKYKTDSKEFWNFTYDQMARYDVYNTINYILNFTNHTKVAYVGHSEGTIQMFASPTVQPLINDKIAYFAALAPVAYVHHQKSPVFDLLAYLDIDKLFLLLGDKQFLPGDIVHLLAPELCNTIPYGCDDFLILLCGPSQDLNVSRIDVYISETPADTSALNMAHWAQGVREEVFRMYNYGSAEKNFEVYGQDTPPNYNLSKVLMPTGLYSGTNDWLADPTDVEKLIADLPTNTIVRELVVDGFAHLDFTWGEHANTKVYSYVIEDIEQYLGKGIITNL